MTIPFDELRSGALDLSSGLVSSTYFRFAIATNQNAPSAFAIDNFRIIRDALPGDYNENGVVDTADYVVWRNSVGPNMMPNDPTPGTVDDLDYTFWRSRFGATSDSGSAAGFAATTVPEPTTLCIGAGRVARRIDDWIAGKSKRLNVPPTIFATVNRRCRRTEFVFNS